MGTVTEAGFEWGTTPSLGRIVQASVSANFTATLSGLASGTVYYYRAYVKIEGTTFTGATASFTSAEGGADPAFPGRTGWAELPVYRTDASFDYVYHMRPDASSVRNYSICYDVSYKCPMWVAYPLHSSYLGSVKRTEAWAYDPEIPRSDQPDLSSSYVTGYSRGHMIASNERTVSKPANEQTFYYSNMAPQIQNGFNGGIWGTLENLCDAVMCSDTLYIVTGSYFANTNTTCKDKNGVTVVVPTDFYKVLARSKSGNTGKPLWQLPADQIICAGFWLEHKSYPSGTSLRGYIKSVAEVEALTGFTFFANVPGMDKTSYNASDWGL